MDDDIGPKAKPTKKGKVKDYIFDGAKNLGTYEYDFGDSWEHTIEYEGKVTADKPLKEYPRLIAGKGACPPDDCGGPNGYRELKDTLANPEAENHEEMWEWMEGMGNTRDWKPTDWDIKDHLDDYLKEDVVGDMM